MSSMDDFPPTPPPPASGGVPASGPFELSGGILCLDFVNSWGDRARSESDQLRDFDDLLAFGAQTGLLGGDRRERLSAWSAGDPAAAAAALAAACALRESLYGIFAARAHEREIPPRDLARLNAMLREALPHLRVEAQPAEPADRSPGSAPVRGAPRFGWAFEANLAPTSPLWPIARSAAELLVSSDLARVTQCDGDRCTWLFLDQSRTHTRRWCSMESCGNRAKAKRHYQRRREA